MAAIDYGMVLAVMTLGWGQVLLLYPAVAHAHGWPSGRWQSAHAMPARGLAYGCIALALLFALWRAIAGFPLGAVAIPVFGVAWAVFWIGFLRVGAQSALLLAPLGAILLVVRWLS